MSAFIDRKQLEVPGILERLDNKEVLIIVFSALQYNREPSFDFTNVFEKYKDRADVIFIRDINHLWYQAGTDKAEGNFDAIIRYLRPITWRYKRVITIGASMGGYAAIATTAAIKKVSLCIALGPQTFIDEENREKYNDQRWQHRMVILNKAMKWTPYFDLTPYLQEKHDGRPIYIFYGDDYREDKVHALHVKDSNGVHLHEVKSAGHYVARAMRDSGMLDKVIEQAIKQDELIVNSLINN